MAKIDKHYVSEIDKQMADFDAKHPKSPSQQAEIDKYRAIHQLRDIPTPAKPMDDEIWN